MWILAADNQASVEANVSKAWEKLDAMIDGLFGLLPNICIAIGVFLVIFIAAKVTKKLIQRTTRDKASSNIGTVLGRLAQWGIMLVGLMVAVSIVSPSVGPAEFMGALGVTSVAIGFAFKDILQNFLAGILILLREPFKIGDAIEVSDYSGTVKAIETRSTILETWDGQDVIIPNGQIFTSAVEVITANPHRRQDCVIGVGYDEDLRRAHDLILETIRGVDGVLNDPAPFVQTTELGGSAVNVKAYWWTKNEDFGSVGSEVVTQLKERLEAAEVDMPFPTQVTLLRDQRDNGTASSPDRSSQRNEHPQRQLAASAD